MSGRQLESERPTCVRRTSSVVLHQQTVGGAFDVLTSPRFRTAVCAFGICESALLLIVTLVPVMRGDTALLLNTGVLFNVAAIVLSIATIRAVPTLCAPLVQWF